MSRKDNKIKALTAYGDSEMKVGNDANAASAYSEVMSLIPWDTIGEERTILRHAYNNLCALCLSHDECAWEIASQVVGDYNQYLQEHLSE